MIGEAIAIGTALLWAASTVIAAKMLKEMDPLSVNALRTLFSSISMLFITFIMGEMKDLFNLDHFGAFLVILAAITGFGVGDTCLFKGITLIGVSKSYTIAYTYPFFTMILGILFLEEPFQLSYWIGTLIIFFGIANILRGENNSHGRENSLGLLAAFVTAILWSFGATLAAIGLKTIGAMSANTIRFPMLFIFLFPMSRLWLKKPKLNKRNLALLAASGILGMTLGGVAFLFSIKFIGVSRAAPLSASSPVWASLMSNMFLNEKITLKILASSLMVIAGTYFLF